MSEYKINNKIDHVVVDGVKIPGTFRSDPEFDLQTGELVLRMRVKKNFSVVYGEGHWTEKVYDYPVAVAALTLERGREYAQREGIDLDQVMFITKNAIFNDSLADDSQVHIDVYWVDDPAFFEDWITENMALRGNFTGHHLWLKDKERTEEVEGIGIDWDNEGEPYYSTFSGKKWLYLNPEGDGRQLRGLKGVKEIHCDREVYENLPHRFRVEVDYLVAIGAVLKR